MIRIGWLLLTLGLAGSAVDCQSPSMHARSMASPQNQPTFQANGQYNINGPPINK